MRYFIDQDTRERVPAVEVTDDVQKMADVAEVLDDDTQEFLWESTDMGARLSVACQGRWIKVQPGSWLLRRANGILEVQPPEVFHHRYVEEQ